MPHTGNVLHPEFHRVLSCLKTFFSNLSCVEARRRCVRVHAESSCAPLVWWLWWCWGWVTLYVEHRWECSPPQARFLRLYTSILFTKIMFLERFRNVDQAIVNKKSHFFRPSAELPERCTLQGVLFNFQDLCGEGGLDAEHLLLCGPPKDKSIVMMFVTNKFEILQSVVSSHNSPMFGHTFVKLMM